MNGPGVYGDRRQTAYSGPTASAMQPPASMDLHLSSSEYVSSCSHSDDSAAAVPFAQLLSNAAAGGSDWKVLNSPTSILPGPERFQVLFVNPDFEATDNLELGSCLVMSSLFPAGCRSEWMALRASQQRCAHPQELMVWLQTWTGWLRCLSRT